MGNELLAILGVIEAQDVDPGLQRFLIERAMSLLLEMNPSAAMLAAALLSKYPELANAIPVSEIEEGLVSHSNLVFGGDGREREATPVVDLLIVTIKEVEFASCLRAFGVERGVRSQKLRGGLRVHEVTYEGHRVAVVCVGFDGNAESALFLAKALQDIRFSAVALVGMAAGVQRQVKLGQVIIAEEIWASDFAVLRPGGSIPRPKTYAIPSSVLSELNNFSQEVPNWAEAVVKELAAIAEGDQERSAVRVPNREDVAYKRGVIFAGNVLVEDGSLPDIADRQNSRLVGVEMEGAGFALACCQMKFDRWLVLRGVADYAQEDREKDWQFAATYAAATYLREALKAGLVLDEPSPNGAQ